MISVCIPTKNAGPEFARYLRGWREQKVEDEVELVVIDSGSRDSTVDTARQLGARVASIAPEEFNHGETRNRLAREARGDILVFTVQDASPASDTVLAELARPLHAQPELAAVTGEQIPHPQADAVARWEVTAHNAIISAGPPLKRYSPPNDPLRGDFLERLRNVSFDNVCSAIRRSVWEKFPFGRIEFAEDLDWAVRVLRAGHGLLRNPAARVHHSHNSAPYQRLKRAFVSRRALNRILEMPSPGAPWAEEEVLPEIGAYLGLLEGACRELGRQPEPVRRLRLVTTPGYWMRRALRRARLEGLEVMIALPHQPVTDTLAGNFNTAMRHLLKFHRGLSRNESGKAARQLGLQVLGDFLADCHTTAAAANQLPDWLEELGGALGRGV